MTDKEAMKLVKILENIEDYRVTMTAAHELRRLHFENKELKERLAQRTWVGLTKADINEIWKGEPMLLPWDMTRTLAIEQRLKEKNT